MFRIYVDDSGHHDLKSSEIPEQRYLGLTGVIMRLDYERGEFTQALNRLKTAVFGNTDVVLHRTEVIRRVGPFAALRDDEIRRKFDDGLIRLIEESTYRVFTVVIDKLEHKKRYLVWRFQPYHYCMTVLLERYAQWLKRHGLRGDVLFESRGKKENRQLEAAYSRIYTHGTDHVPERVFQETLTSRKMKLEGKSGNIAGLQLADLIVNPSCRDLICEKTNIAMEAPFGKKIVEVLKKKKYLRRFDGHVPGWGTKWLP